MSKNKAVATNDPSTLRKNITKDSNFINYPLGTYSLC